MPVSELKDSSLDSVVEVQNSLLSQPAVNGKHQLRATHSEEHDHAPSTPRPTILRTKARSLSESSYADGQLRGILKGRQRRASECQNKDVKLSTSGELTTDGSTDSEDGPREPCVKTVRFDDRVYKQTFRMNSSILGRRSKNQKKAEKRKRAQQSRRLSEGESTDGDEGVDTNLSKSLESLTIAEEEEEDASMLDQSINSAPTDKKSKSKAKRRKNKVKREDSLGVSDDDDVIFAPKPRMNGKPVQKALRKNSGSFQCDSDSGTSTCDYLP